MTDQLETEVEIEAAPELEPVDDGQGESLADIEETEASEESVVTFGEDEPEQPEELPNHLRKLLRDEKKKTRDLQKKLEQGKAEEPTALGAAPTLEAFDFDEDEYRTALTDWIAEKGKQDTASADAKSQAEAQDRAYQERKTEYVDAQASFDAEAFDDAESSVSEALSEVQQSILVKAFGKGAAPIVMGLGANSARLKELAGITDHVMFIVAATRLESQMKVSQRKPKTSPEKRVTGTGGANTGDTHLEQLEAEAEKSGDRSKILAYNRQKRQAS